MEILESRCMMAFDSADYSLSGDGQTIVLIDSGIIASHAGFDGRVVGGWDFAENDNNPNDDVLGHGTHMAGVAAGELSGLATDADIVALRVFNDSGASSIAWVSQALTWVHNNRNNFPNPITTVGLSLAFLSNSTQVPDWGELEDELAQLKNDGIFVAVGAGNNYSTYQIPGLAYPAISPHVYAAMTTQNGELMSYSQRLSTALGTIGNALSSTIPDSLGNNNGIQDDYSVRSGTSVSAAYLAGASMLIREVLGVGATTDQIYDVLYDNADFTSDGYHDMNLDASLDVLNVPVITSLSATPGDDTVVYNNGTLTINGQVFPTTSPLDGLAGNDTLTVYTSSDVTLAGPSIYIGTFHAHSFESITVYTTGKSTFYDSVVNDTYITAPNYSAMVGAGYYNLVYNTWSEAFSENGGWDNATMFDSAGNDTFISHPTWAQFLNHRANGFDKVEARATAGGWDNAYFFDSLGDDEYISGSNYAWMSDGPDSYYNVGLYFDLMVGYASDGFDIARMTYGNLIEVGGSWAKLNSPTFFQWANGFSRVEVRQWQTFSQISPVDFVLALL